MRADDYRDELEHLIEAHFPSRRAFCEATGISPAMLAKFLAGRKDLSPETLTNNGARFRCTSPTRKRGIRPNPRLRVGLVQRNRAL